MSKDKKTILLVEDEKPLYELIRYKLVKENFKVVLARSADQAFQCLKDRVDIDAVWLDHYLLGKGSGLDFVIKIQKNKSWKNLPVFLISNTVSPEKIQIYLKLGIKKCYTKVDFKLNQIITDIKKCLK